MTVNIGPLIAFRNFWDGTYAEVEPAVRYRTWPMPRLPERCWRRAPSSMTLITTVRYEMCEFREGNAL